MIRLTLFAATVLAVAAWQTGGAEAQPISGIYIGAGGGANFLEAQKPYLTIVRALYGEDRTYYETGSVAVGSVGYGFGNGLRAELEGDFRFNRLSFSNSLAQTSFGGLPSTSAGGYERKYGAMINAMYDLDIGSPYVFPYIGGGVGYMQTEFRRQSSVAVPGFGEIDRVRGSAGSYAYQGIAGLSFPVPHAPGLSLTAEYRFLGLGDDRNFGGRYIQQTAYTTSSPGLARERFKTDDNHSLMLGIRYAFNPASPPPPPAAPPVAAAPATTRTYMVFFDWDRADLTDRARQIVAQAAQASTRVQTTRIEVNGYTDTSGTAGYNLGLSQRRAQSVAAELVRDGVPGSAIGIRGFGETHPLVPTADGVREPQNRRVEIILR